MSKALKTQAKNARGQLIENQLRRADPLGQIDLGRAEQGTPQAIRAAIPAAFDQGGGAPRAHSIPLCVTPFSLSGQCEVSQ
jgi:hypothetical protein